ncbi:hypothetical protein JHK82_024692 [Glycine max]|nr:hypothetical protein JHK82_024692 [Glycine max]
MEIKFPASSTLPSSATSSPPPPRAATSSSPSPPPPPLGPAISPTSTSGTPPPPPTPSHSSTKHHPTSPRRFLAVVGDLRRHLLLPYTFRGGLWSAIRMPWIAMRRTCVVMVVMCGCMLSVIKYPANFSRSCIMVKFVSLIKWLKKNGMSGIQVVAAGAKFNLRRGNGSSHNVVNGYSSDGDLCRINKSGCFSSAVEVDRDPSCVSFTIVNILAPIYKRIDPQAYEKVTSDHSGWIGITGFLIACFPNHLPLCAFRFYVFENVIVFGLGLIALGLEGSLDEICL